jgi:hypothetical protein
LLGDTVEKALSTVGITKERVERWLGRPCECDYRQEKLNALSYWAVRVLSGKTSGMKQQLEEVLEDEGA